jgi:hypothetical protein
LISDDADATIAKDANYSWYMKYKPKDSTAAYSIVASAENKRGYESYNKFQIDKEGSYRVEVQIVDRDKRKGSAYFDFEVNGDFILNYPNAIKGDKVRVEANVSGLGLDTNSPIVWILDGGTPEKNNSQIFEFYATKNYPDKHKVELIGVNINRNSQEASIHSQIEIPVKDPEINIIVPDMTPGYTNQGYFTSGKSFVAKTQLGPAGSTWENASNIHYLWSDWEDKSLSTLNVPALSSKTTTISVLATRLGDDGKTQQQARGIIYLKARTPQVLGAFTSIYNLLTGSGQYVIYSFLGIFCIMIIYLSWKKRQESMGGNLKFKMKNYK